MTGRVLFLITNNVLRFHQPRTMFKPCVRFSFTLQECSNIKQIYILTAEDRCYGVHNRNTEFLPQQQILFAMRSSAQIILLRAIRCSFRVQEKVLEGSEVCRSQVGFWKVPKIPTQQVAEGCCAASTSASTGFQCSIQLGFR